ncbi:hypothetical protein BDQ17DRAFT_760866 [Cyathus striatus]|nr:hypothetical protein BDQ17DRAFT_760866 [Cyathus striatus]
MFLADRYNKSSDMIASLSNTSNSSCLKAREVLIEVIDSPVTVRTWAAFGPTELFFLSILYPEKNYLLIEISSTIAFLLTLKVRYPECHMLIIRSQESHKIIQAYGFYDKCLCLCGSKGGVAKFLIVCFSMRRSKEARGYAYAHFVMESSLWY